MSDQLDNAARIQQYIDDAKVAVKKLHEEGKYDLKCIFCNELVFFVEAPVSMEKGHIYSRAGNDEFKNTRICEFCFDETCEKFAGNEEENEYDSRGSDFYPEGSPEREATGAIGPASAQLQEGMYGPETFS